jgi:hypothetical protein
MWRSDVEQAVAIGCGVLGLGVTYLASVRLHVMWSLAMAAVPFAVAFVALLVFTIGRAAIKPIALVVGYLSAGCCVGVAVVDQRHLGFYLVGFAL